MSTSPGSEDSGSLSKDRSFGFFTLGRKNLFGSNAYISGSSKMDRRRSVLRKSWSQEQPTGPASQILQEKRDILLENLKQKVISRFHVPYQTYALYVHGDAHVFVNLRGAICAAVDDCLRFGLILKRPVLFNREPPTYSLLKEVAKSLPEARDVVKRVQELEERANVYGGYGHTFSLSSLSYVDSVGRNASPGSGTLPRHLWIRIALFQKSLSKIVDYLMENAELHYERVSIIAHPFDSQLFADLLLRAALSCLTASRSHQCALFFYVRVLSQLCSSAIGRVDEFVSSVALIGPHQVATCNACRKRAEQASATRDHGKGIGDRSSKVPGYRTSPYIFPLLPASSSSPSPHFTCFTVVPSLLIAFRHSLLRGRFVPLSAVAGGVIERTSTSEATSDENGTDEEVTLGSFVTEEEAHVHHYHHHQLRSNFSPSLPAQKLTQAKDYVESLHQNERTPLLYGKNNVLVQPSMSTSRISGYLSMHRTGLDADSGLELKWAPNRAMSVPQESEEQQQQQQQQQRRNHRPYNGLRSYDSAEGVSKLMLHESSYWDFVLDIDIKKVVYIHCHRHYSDTDSGTVILVRADGVQYPPLTFPAFSQVVSFIQCLETHLAPKGSLNPRTDDVDWEENWLAYTRSVNLVRNRLKNIVYPRYLLSKPPSPNAKPLTAELWRSGIILASQVWPFLLDHYPWSATPMEIEEIDKRTRMAYERSVSEWLAAEVIILQQEQQHSQRGSMAGTLTDHNTPEVDSRSASLRRNSLVSDKQTVEDTAPSSRHSGEVNENSGDSHASTNSTRTTNELPPLPPKWTHESRALKINTGVGGIGYSGCGNSIDLADDATEECTMTTTDDDDTIENNAVANRVRRLAMARAQSCPNTPKSLDHLTVTIRNTNSSAITQEDNSDVDEVFSPLTLPPTRIGGQDHQSLTQPSREKKHSRYSRSEVSGASYSSEVLEALSVNIQRIDKDVARCDRNYHYFSKGLSNGAGTQTAVSEQLMGGLCVASLDLSANLYRLRTIMCTWIWQHMETGYVQGMCDLLAPLLVVLEDEALTYACFSQLMLRMLSKFPLASSTTFTSTEAAAAAGVLLPHLLEPVAFERAPHRRYDFTRPKTKQQLLQETNHHSMVGHTARTNVSSLAPAGNTLINRQFESLRSLIEVLDPVLAEHMHLNEDNSHLYFYRWLLLDFKREFKYADVFLAWETIWTSYRLVCPDFEIFIAFALIQYYRDIIIFYCFDYTDIIRFYNELQIEWPHLECGAPSSYHRIPPNCAVEEFESSFGHSFKRRMHLDPHLSPSYNKKSSRISNSTSSTSPSPIENLNFDALNDPTDETMAHPCHEASPVSSSFRYLTSSDDFFVVQTPSKAINESDQQSFHLSSPPSGFGNLGGTANTKSVKSFRPRVLFRSSNFESEKPVSSSLIKGLGAPLKNQSPKPRFSFVGPLNQPKSSASDSIALSMAKMTVWNRMAAATTPVTIVKTPQSATNVPRLGLSGSRQAISAPGVKLAYPVHKEPEFTIRRILQMACGLSSFSVLFYGSRGQQLGSISGQGRAEDKLYDDWVRILSKE
ncbi:unnamed protein product [Hydatigera taeniaeformis]|uniref:Protein kinase domain-containing protein n=1 Tax=Hydatigena taeniaeformis TaxID=6205 RepID=A0A0R3X3N2_HYDTA|nr:unnamed protein product [Hydatigera taeniaeformis]